MNLKVNNFKIKAKKLQISKFTQCDMDSILKFPNPDFKTKENELLTNEKEKICEYETNTKIGKPKILGNPMAQTKKYLETKFNSKNNKGTSIK